MSQRSTKNANELAHNTERPITASQDDHQQNQQQQGGNANGVIRNQQSQQNQQNNQQPPKRTAFVHKLYAMLSDPNLSHLIWWSRNDDEGVFALHPGTEFANALTNYFKHGNVSSFVRQLHMYGFHKVFDASNDDNDNDRKEQQQNNNNNSSNNANNNNTNNANSSNSNNSSNNNSSNSNNNNNSQNSDDLVWEFRHSTGNFKKGDEASLAYIKRRSSNKSIPEDDLKNNRLTDTNVFYPQYYYAVPPEYVYNQMHPSQPHQPDQYYVVQGSAGPEYHQQRSQSPSSSYQIGYQPIPRNSQYYGDQLIQQRQPSYPYQHQPQHVQAHPQYQPPPHQAQQHYPQQIPLQQHHLQQHQQGQSPRQASIPDRTLNSSPAPGQPSQPGYGEIDHSHVQRVTSDLIDQQRQISVKSEYLDNELRSTSSDVLRFSESIPKLAPAFQQTGYRYNDGLSNLRQSFNLRADYYKPSPLSAEMDPHHPNAHTQPGSPLPPPHPSAIPQHIQSLQHHQQPSRNQSIHFWENTGQRQPSVFVDPLNASLSGSASSSSIPSSNNSRQPSTSSNLVPPPAPNHVYQLSPSAKGSNSVPHIHFQANKAHTRRNESLPSNIPAPATSTVASPQAQLRQLPPRSVPAVDRGSIPNIAHLTSQLRPSIVEVHKNAAANANGGTQNTSVSSNSTYNTVYSASSSISSLSSSRTSYGSITPVYTDTVSSPPSQGLPHHAHHSHHHGHHHQGSISNPSSSNAQPHSPYNNHLLNHINKQSVSTRAPGSPSRFKEIVEENSKSKLSVSSLLTDASSDEDRESLKRGSDDLEDGKDIKRAKSVSE